MELREFAERVLFSASLEEKLLDPGEVTDERPGPAVVAPASPGRPRGLAFKASGEARGAFPGDRALGTEEGRGRMLHFFANHELLATELMALVLLRFPDAPPAFRAGVLRTLRDEQEHTRRYLARMRDCGVGFGSIPVSGYFWRAVAPMAHPIDFVAGLSLTFEQANLDHSRHYASRFAAVGDAETAALLGQIHRDEIAHVAHGLKWFRRWKQDGLGDWEALCRQLRFPLSPSRARGTGFDAEGRRAAGLDEAFIGQLRLHGQSRGRAPTVWLFNPLVEGRLARGRAFAPGRVQAALARDLAVLPAFLARRDDVVLVPEIPSDAWKAAVSDAGWALPEFVATVGGRVDAGGTLASRKVSRLRPWGWGPDAIEAFGPLVDAASDGGPNAVHRDAAALGRLHSKETSASWLGEYLAAHGPAPWLAEEWVVGTGAGSAGEALGRVAAIRARGHHRAVAKEAIGLAGGNALRLWEPEVLENQARWIERVCASGGRVVVEPWLERVSDFSMQLEVAKDGARFLGFAGLETDHRGGYLGNRVAPPPHGPPAEALAALRGSGLQPPDAVAWMKAFAGWVGRKLASAGYEGPAGIDAFVYRDASGVARLKPMVELNPRHTMGRLALELMRGVAPGSSGRLRLAGAGRGDGRDLASLAREWASDPPRMEGEPRARMRSGTLVLNDPATATACLAAWEVRDARVRAGKSL